MLCSLDKLSWCKLQILTYLSVLRREIIAALPLRTYWFWQSSISFLTAPGCLHPIWWSSPNIGIDIGRGLHWCSLPPISLWRQGHPPPIVTLENSSYEKIWGSQGISSFHKFTPLSFFDSFLKGKVLFIFNFGNNHIYTGQATNK